MPLIRTYNTDYWSRSTTRFQWTPVRFYSHLSYPATSQLWPSWVSTELINETTLLILWLTEFPFDSIVLILFLAFVLAFVFAFPDCQRSNWFSSLFFLFLAIDTNSFHSLILFSSLLLSFRRPEMRKDSVNSIFQNDFFHNFDWPALMSRTMIAPHIPRKEYLENSHSKFSKKSIGDQFVGDDTIFSGF